MKTMLLFVIATVGSMAFAQTEGKPFTLNAGKYSMECWNSQVQTVDGVAARTDGYDVGLTTVTDNGQLNVQTDEYTSLDGSSTKAISSVQFADQGAGVFKINIGVANTFTNGGKSTQDSHTYETSTKVEGNKSYNLTVKSDNGTPHPGVGESVWRKTPDGRIFNESFIREKIVSTTPDGKHVEILASNNTCIFTIKN